MFLVYEENYLPDCDAADSFELFTTEDNARAEMERRKQKYLKQSHLSLPNDPGADANSICLKTNYRNQSLGEIYIRLLELDAQ